jgi:hypothetical protein
MIEETVAPGETATFRFAAAVPPFVGSIEARFTPVVEYLGWMQHQEGTSLIIFSNPDNAAHVLFLPLLRRS